MPYVIFEQDGQFCLRNKATGKPVAGSCHKSKADTMAMMRALYANVPDASKADDMLAQIAELKATWTTAYINNLPDGAFLYIEPGGSKDGEGKTTPRSLRHFPYKDSAGSVDLPHLRNALARIPQSSLSADVKARVIAKAQAIAKQHGIGEKSAHEEYDMNESLTYYGGAVKALGDGKIGGYVAIFTTENDPDLQGDFFSKATDFYLESGDQRPIIYDHGLDKTLKRRQLTRATVKIDDAGVWMEGKLAMRDAYEKKIYEMAEKGKLGWSTGSASHLVARTQRGKSYHLDSWPIVEASLTPTPVEPRTAAITLKSLAEAHIDFDDLIKSVHEEALEDAPFAVTTFPALSEIVAPADLKGWDEGSEAVAAAAEEFLRYGKIFAAAVKSYAVRLEDSARLRFERDGRPVSKAKREWVATARKRLDQMRADHQLLDAYLKSIQSLFEMTDAEDHAANEEARFELLRTHKITGNRPLQGD